MKTININLLGDLSKISKTNLKKSKEKNSFDTRNQIFAYIFIIGIFVIFTVSFGGWMLVKKMTSNLDKRIVKLNENINILREQEVRLSTFRKNLKKEKEITNLKIIIQKQLNNSFFPWSSVLKEISNKIPKNIIILKIEKSGNANKLGQNNDSMQLNISGIIPTNKKQEPLMLISLFIFNLNENPNSLLSNAKISNLEFDDKTKAYKFEISVAINYKFLAIQK